MVLFHVAAFGCGTFKHEFETAPGYDNSYSVGYWKVENPEPGGSGCVGYGDDTSGLPKVWKIGRAAGVIGSLIIWTIALLVAVASFYSFKNPLSSFRLVGWLMIVMSPMSLLLLVGKFSEDGQYLKIDTGGIVALITSILWLVGAIFTMCGMRERAVTLVPRDIGGVVVGAAPRQATVVPSGMAEDTHQQDHGQAVAAHAVFSRERM
jgi:hypothetical protein